MDPSAIWEMFSEFLMFCNIKIIAKYQKQGKYLQILHEAAFDNYFIVEDLLKSHAARVYHLLTNCAELALPNLRQT